MKTSERRFTLADALVLIAASAISIACIRGAIHERQRQWLLGLDTSSLPLLYQLLWWVHIPIPALITFTLAILYLRLRSPRPSLRRLSSQPGAVACACVATVLTIHALLIVLGIGLARVPGLSHPGVLNWSRLWTIDPAIADAGLAILGAWFVLRANRRYRADSSWLDRTGRVLGVLWISCYLIQRATAISLGF